MQGENSLIRAVGLVLWSVGEVQENSRVPSLAGQASMFQLRLKYENVAACPSPYYKEHSADSTACYTLTIGDLHTDHVRS